MREILLAVLLVSVALVGCVGSEEDPDLPDDDVPDNASAVWAANAVPFQEGHDHNDRSQHEGLSTENFRIDGYDPLETEYHGGTSGGYLCGEVAEDGDRDVAVTHSFGTDVAFVVADVSDPSQPEKIGEMVFQNSHTYDVAVTPDARYVAVAVSGADTGPDEGPSVTTGDAPSALTMEYRTACGTTVQQTEEIPFQSGVVLVDLSDPTDPQVADFLSQPVLGPHSIFATQVDGTYHILASTTNLGHQASYFTFLGIEETPFGPRLIERFQYSAQYPGQSGEEPALTNGHVDGWIQQHPTEDSTYAYLANWNGGLHVLEHDPSTNTWERVAVWNDYAPSAGAGMTGQIHGAFPIEETWEVTGRLCEPSASQTSQGSSCDKHYTFIGQEVVSRPTERPTGQIIMLDTTDPADPTAIARWTLPTDVEFDGNLRFSTHYVTVVNQTLFVSLYHGGVWAVGTEPIEGTHQLPTKGVFMPDRTPPNPSLEFADFQWTPVVLDVFRLGDGLVVFDGTSGLYTVSFDESVEVPRPEPWTEDEWVGNRTTSPQGPLPS